MAAATRNPHVASPLTAAVRWPIRRSLTPVVLDVDRVRAWGPLLGTLDHTLRLWDRRAAVVNLYRRYDTSLAAHVVALGPHVAWDELEAIAEVVPGADVGAVRRWRARGAPSLRVSCRGDRCEGLLAWSPTECEEPQLAVVEAAADELPSDLATLLAWAATVAGWDAPGTVSVLPWTTGPMLARVRDVSVDLALYCQPRHGDEAGEAVASRQTGPALSG